jgi:hypothetical protein
MRDQIFGEINQEDGSWYGEYPLDFGGTICSAEILIRSEDEIAESQRDAFRCFIEKWPDLNEIFCKNPQNLVKQRITPHFLTTDHPNYYEFTTKE